MKVFQKISENVSSFARQNKNTIIDYSNQFSKEVRANLRLSLGASFLEFHSLEKNFKIKTKNKEESI